MVVGQSKPFVAGCRMRPVARSATWNDRSLRTITREGSGSSPSTTSVGSGEAPEGALARADGCVPDAVGATGELDGVVATP